MRSEKFSYAKRPPADATAIDFEHLPHSREKEGWRGMGEVKK